MELHGRYTFFAEGARGHLTKELKRIFELDAESQPQVYGIGLKELWDIDPEKHEPGRVIHTQGWPLADAWGGGFLYHQAAGQVALGFVVALNYKNPWLSPVRGVPALEAASGDPPVPRGRPPRLLWRAGDQRGRLAVGAQARLPGRRADRLRGRLRQRAAHQGQPHRDEIGHARRRSRLRRDRRRPRRRHAGRLRAGAARILGREGAAEGAQRRASWWRNGAESSAPCSPGTDMWMRQLHRPAVHDEAPSRQ